jgi:hypothetical protein
MDTPSSPAPPAAGGPLSPTRAIADAWRTFLANAWISIGVAVVLCAILVAGQFIPFVNFLFLLFVAPALYAGGAYYFLRGARGEQPPFEDAFEGFRRWPSVTGTVLLIGFVSVLILLPLLGTMLGVVGLAALMEARPDRAPNLTPAAMGVLWLVALVNYPAMIWWSLRTSMALFVVMEPERPGVMESLRRSWKLTGGSFWRIVGFALLTIPVVLLGLLALCVGVVPAAIVAYFGWAHVYLQLRARA